MIVLDCASYLAGRIYPNKAPLPGNGRQRGFVAGTTCANSVQRVAPRTPATADLLTGFRADIEGMRAVAVIAVLLYHSTLGPFRGGFIGVDVFFVVSGYLITGVLLNEIGNGARALPQFWARRARRLLPASVIVIITTVVVGRFVLDPLTDRSLAHDAAAAAVFVVNIVFARRDSDYFTAQLSPSPLLHFWSLAVEEQFYLLWPPLLLALARFRRHFTLALVSTFGALWVASFVASIAVTKTHGPWAFYLLPTRAWDCCYCCSRRWTHCSRRASRRTRPSRMGRSLGRDCGSGDDGRTL